MVVSRLPGVVDSDLERKQYFPLLRLANPDVQNMVEARTASFFISLPHHGLSIRAVSSVSY